METGLSTDRKTELLGGVELFRSVAPEHLASIAERLVEVEYPAGATIVRAGEIGTGFFIVAGGAVRVVRDGKTIARLGPGEFFGELSLLDRQPRIAQVVADEDTLCLALPSWDFERILLAEPALTLAILRTVAARLRAVVDLARQ
ncbi:MAG TPA: cyclic nucleotide-binding domain-containing protein [Candidatus Limnocylindrales bacterium]|nr:cyclic nucleotide-binding domain-containing protein [Candidatus Limnocylindrales bacterium]